MTTTWYPPQPDLVPPGRVLIAVVVTEPGPDVPQLVRDIAEMYVAARRVLDPMWRPR
jgi:hypothetical protein